MIMFSTCWQKELQTEKIIINSSTDFFIGANFI